MTSDDDAEVIAAARAGFLDEAADMLQQFEAALLVMESDPGNAENLNAAFRAAHTIKGTAGLFGCDAVVSFTHEVETLMEALRSGDLAVSSPSTVRTSSARSLWPKAKPSPASSGSKTSWRIPVRSRRSMKTSPP